MINYNPKSMKAEEFINDEECFTVKYSPLQTVYGDFDEEKTYLKEYRK